MKARPAVPVPPRAAVLFATAIVLVASAAPADVLIDCDAAAGGPDLFLRGFYIPEYTGETLESIDVQGSYTVEMTVRQDTYDGPVVATAQATAEMSGDPYDTVLVPFVFGSVTVSPGTLLTFAMVKLAGTGIPYFDAGVPSCPIIETGGTTPPLDTFRRDGVRTIIRGQGTSPVESMSWGRTRAAYR